MTLHSQVDLETALAGLSQLYPDLRFGQLIEMVAVLAGEDAPENLSDIDDARLIQTAMSHLAHRFRQLGSETTAVLTSPPPARMQLIRMLRQLQQRYSGWRFGQLVLHVAGWSDVSLYDAEDEQLLAAARQHLV
jgi:hypothetical protein